MNVEHSCRTTVKLVWFCVSKTGYPNSDSHSLSSTFFIASGNVHTYAIHGRTWEGYVLPFDGRPVTGAPVV